jgi:parvulin-like peptidyl-prolyl isomerase
MFEIKLKSLLGLSVAITLLAVAVDGCGTSKSQTVATVGKSTIDTVVLDHWMNVVMGNVYSQLTRTAAPAGLVSAPPRYSACVSASRRIGSGSTASSLPSTAELRMKCRQLDAAIKEQALSELLSVLWRVEEAAQLGVRVSEREVSRQLQETAYKEYASPAQFRRELAEKHLTLTDMRYLIKRDLLAGKFQERLQRHAGALGGGEQTYARLANENTAKWTARTDCKPGYLAWQCKQFGSSKEASPTATQVIEQLRGAKVTPGLSSG